MPQKRLKVYSENMNRRYKTCLAAITAAILLSCSSYQSVSFPARFDFIHSEGKTQIKMTTERFIYVPSSSSDKDKIIIESMKELEKGNFVEAERILQELIYFFPDDEELYNNLGVVYESRGDVSSALSCYMTACRINGKSVFRHNLKYASTRP